MGKPSTTSMTPGSTSVALRVRGAGVGQGGGTQRRVRPRPLGAAEGPHTGLRGAAADVSARLSHCSERVGREGVRSGAPCDGRRAIMPYKSTAISTEVSDLMHVEESLCSQLQRGQTCADMRQDEVVGKWGQ